MQSQKQQNDLCSFPRQPFNITVIQVYASTTNAEEAEVEWFYEGLQDLLELTPNFTSSRHNVKRTQLIYILIQNFHLFYGTGTIILLFHLYNEILCSLPAGKRIEVKTYSFIKIKNMKKQTRLGKKNSVTYLTKDLPLEYLKNSFKIIKKKNEQ